MPIAIPTSNSIRSVQEQSRNRSRPSQMDSISVTTISEPAWPDRVDICPNGNGSYYGVFYSNTVTAIMLITSDHSPGVNVLSFSSNACSMRHHVANNASSLLNVRYSSDPCATNNADSAHRQHLVHAKAKASSMRRRHRQQCEALFRSMRRQLCLLVVRYANYAPAR